MINDLDGDLINFWRIVRDHHEELIQSFDYTLCSREVFNEYRARFETSTYDNDIQRAHIFYYLNKSTFGGRMNTTLAFGVNKGKDRQHLRMENVESIIRQCYERIKNVVIEHLSYQDILQRYDHATSFFFLDPPYRTGKQYRPGSFSDEDYQFFADQCRNLKGKFLLTINDDPFIRDLFKEFNFIEREVNYTLNISVQKKSKELIITNYDCVQGA